MLKSLITALAVAAVAITGVVSPIQAHHKPGYHDGLPKMPKPQTPQLPRK